MARQDINEAIQRWLAGDEPAFSQILEFYYPRLLASSLRMISVREDSEELVMNALLKIWQYRHRMSEVRQFDNYLFGILRQEVVALSRKRVMTMQNIEELPLNDLGTVLHPEFTLTELISRYQAALLKLSPKQREVFLALREQDLSRKEIAERTGMSVHTVNSHMNSALKILRQEMKEYPDVLLGVLVGGSLFL